ncbi:unnamed protein product [Notodromas monacha]|uniref:FAD/NAD(P)-binding domain-containing protein n=1 Tax=Notodromas monacha TaxID=399045 RepID=A0A7R9BIF9_9CRUS|nr:unnamed protein product [Notodromas monacha]CAG0916101.1 unnamed protein product [Notodromas monacha]
MVPGHPEANRTREPDSGFTGCKMRKTGTNEASGTEKYDVLIIGGGLAAVRTAKAAAKYGRRVLLCAHNYDDELLVADCVDAVDGTLFSTASGTEKYDVLIIGGGLAAVRTAKAAAKYGRRVLLCAHNYDDELLVADCVDAVDGTLFSTDFRSVIRILARHAAEISRMILSGEPSAFGWQLQQSSEVSSQMSPHHQHQQQQQESTPTTLRHNWLQFTQNAKALMETTTRREAVEDLEQYGVNILRSLPSVIDANTVRFDEGKSVRTECLVLVPVMRPKIPEIPGIKEFSTPVESMFHVKHDPGKTLIIGASSSALEAAGLLRSLSPG